SSAVTTRRMSAAVAVAHASTSATIEPKILLVIASSFAVSVNADWVTSNPSNCAGATSSPPPLAGEGQGGGTQYDRAFQFTPSPPLAGEGAERVCRSHRLHFSEIRFSPR